MSQSLLAFLIVLFLAPGTALAQEGPSTLNAARAALERGDVATAAQLLAQVDEQQADRDDLDFLRGTLAVAQGRYLDGIVAFRSILARDPSLNRVRLDLAQAYFLQGDDVAAAFHFRAALVQDVPPEVRRNVEVYLQRIAERRRWTISTTLAIAPDTNINTATSAESVDIFGLPFLLDPATQGRSGVGVTAGIGISDRWPINNVLKLRTAGFLNGTLYGASQFNDIKLDAEAGPAIVLTSQTELAVLATASRRWFGDSRLLTASGARAEATHAFNSRWQLVSAVGWENRSFVTAYAPYSGPAYSASANLAHAVNATTSALGLFAVVREQARDPSFRAWQYISGLTYGQDGLLGGFTAQASVQAALIRYDEPGFFFADARREVQLEYRVGLSHAHIQWWGFAPVFSIVRTDRYSNLALFEYHRTRAEIGLRRVF